MNIDTLFKAAVIYKFKFRFGSNVLDTIISIDILALNLMSRAIVLNRVSI